MEAEAGVGNRWVIGHGIPYEYRLYVGTKPVACKGSWEAWATTARDVNAGGSGSMTTLRRYGGQ